MTTRLTSAISLAAKTKANQEHTNDHILVRYSVKTVDIDKIHVEQMQEHIESKVDIPARFTGSKAKTHTKEPQAEKFVE